MTDIQGIPIQKYFLRGKYMIDIRNIDNLEKENKKHISTV